MRRWSSAILAAVATAATAWIGVAFGEPGAANRPQNLREGTAVSDQVGSIAVAGDRLEFQGEDGRRFVLLENLGLERVARSMAENPHATTWRVSGTATEFQGGNYLLLSRAIQKAAGASQSSELSGKTAREPSAAIDY